MKKTLILPILLASFSFAAPALACSPAPGWPPSEDENFATKDAVFVGTVRNIVQDKSVAGDYRISFDVKAVYKGEVSDTVTIITRSSSAACGYDDGYTTFKTGTVWAVYATGSASDRYHTNSLSLNTKYESVAKATDAMEDFGFTEVGTEEPIACTMQYAPVCGKAADGSIKTYGNACVLGSERATMLYEGECKADGTVPTKNLWAGMRGMDVTWLQNFLIEKATGAASGLLRVVGATGYFGTLTTNALAEYQAANGISPSTGFFGPITRAKIMQDSTPASTASFTGTVEAVTTGCFADGICSVTVDGKEIILLAGLRINTPEVGSLKGVDSIGDLENEIGSEAEVYAAETSEGGASYTLYGSTRYYVKIK